MWVPSPRRCVRSPPSGPHLAPMRPPGSAGGPYPIRESFFAKLLRGKIFSQSLAPLFVGSRCTWTPQSAPHRRHHNLAPMRPPESAGGLPSLRERFFVDLLRGEFSSPSLAPVFVGVISSPLRVESAESPQSPPPQFRADEAAGFSGRSFPHQKDVFRRAPAREVLLSVMDARLCGRHLLAAARGVCRSAPIAAAIIWR